MRDSFAHFKSVKDIRLRYCPGDPCHTLSKNARPPTVCLPEESPEPVYALDRAAFNQGENAKYDFEISESGINSTLVARGPSAVVYKFIEWIVRRLTPRECERLQGYPDDWTVLQKIDNITNDEYSFFLGVFMLDKKIRNKKVKKPPTKESLIKWYNKLDCDGNRYKALGNSLAIPCALRVVAGIVEYENKREETR